MQNGNGARIMTRSWHSHHGKGTRNKNDGGLGNQGNLASFLGLGGWFWFWFGGGNPVFLPASSSSFLFPSRSQSQSYPFHSFLDFFFLFTFYIATLQHCKTRDSYLLAQPPCFSLCLSVSVCDTFLSSRVPSIPHQFRYHFRRGQVITAKFGGGARWCFGLESFSVSRRDPSSISQIVILRCGEAREARSPCLSLSRSGRQRAMARNV